MPMHWNRYPPDWKARARALKAAAGYVCSVCGRQCYKPGEQVRNWLNVCTVAHWDQDPGNNTQANLVVCCWRCHVAHDRPWNVKKRKRTMVLKRAGPTIPMSP